MKELKLEIEELEERIAPGRPGFVDALVGGLPESTPGGPPFIPPAGDHGSHGQPA